MSEGLQDTSKVAESATSTPYAPDARVVEGAVVQGSIVGEQQDASGALAGARSDAIQIPAVPIGMQETSSPKAESNEVPGMTDQPTETSAGDPNKLGADIDGGRRPSNNSKGSGRKSPKRSPRGGVDENGEVMMRVTSGLFTGFNTEAIKEKVRNAKLRPDPYNVHDYYYTTGLFQKIAKHAYFENFTLSVIVVNALWISIDTDGNSADTILDAKAIYVAADVMFFGYFTLELVIRFLAFKKKSRCLRDAWFVFDSALVTLYAFDPFTIGLIAAAQDGGGGLNLPTAVLRLFRLARLSRLVRMLRSLPELMIMIKGMVSATASVGYTLGLLMLITYVFAIALRNLVPKDSDIETNYFSTVPESMHNLLVFGTFLDALSQFIYDTKAESPACFVLLWVYICLAALTVMNMLIGVLCEVISAVAEEEKESMMVDKVNEKFDDVVRKLDKDASGLISWSEFQQILDFPQALRALESVNVDPEIMVDMAEDFFFDDGEQVEVTFEQFMEMVLDLRGGQNASVENIMALAKRFNRKFLNLKCRMDGFTDAIDTIEYKMDKLVSQKTGAPMPVREPRKTGAVPAAAAVPAAEKNNAPIKTD